MQGLGSLLATLALSCATKLSPRGKVLLAAKHPRRGISPKFAV